MLCGDASLVTKSYLTLVIPWTLVQQAPLSMGFSRQEYSSELLFPSAEDLPYSGRIFLTPALQAESLLTAVHLCVCIKSLNIFKKTEIIQNLFFHQNGIDTENQLLKDVSKNSQTFGIHALT